MSISVLDDYLNNSHPNLKNVNKKIFKKFNIKKICFKVNVSMKFNDFEEKTVFINESFYCVCYVTLQVSIEKDSKKRRKFCRWASN